MGIGISMRELQKMSAAAIQALPHAVPIKSGTKTVGVLTPVRNDPQALDAALTYIDQEVARHTPEQEAAIDRLLAERGID